jgi:integrase
MGRTAYKHKNLPKGMRARVKRNGSTWYYLDLGKRADGKRPEVPLGNNYIEALRKYADLVVTATAPAVTVPELLTRWSTETLLTRAAGSQKDISYCLPKLTTFFSNPSPAPLEAVRPVHISQYLDWRKAAPVRANREIAWLSVAWNWARSRGLTDLANPCEGVRRNRESGRDIYVEDVEFNAIHAEADVPLQEFMDLAYLVGQRPGDLRRLENVAARGDALRVQQSKTGTKLRVAIEGRLAELLAKMDQRKEMIRAGGKVVSASLLVDEDGQPMTKDKMRYRFDKARDAAKTKNPELASRIGLIQLRDIRAKSGTDKREAEGLDAAQGLLGHRRADMTEHYTRQRRGKLVKPVD